MASVETWLELALMGLLGATLLHAIRLQRAIKALQNERESLDDAVAGFDNGARQAEAGLARLREAADRLSGEMGHASSLNEDLTLLAERGTLVADRLEVLIRTARGLDHAAGPAPAPNAAQPGAHPGTHPGTLASNQVPPAPVRSQAERNLLLALQAGR